MMHLTFRSRAASGGRSEEGARTEFNIHETSPG